MGATLRKDGHLGGFVARGGVPSAEACRQRDVRALRVVGLDSGHAPDGLTPLLGWRFSHLAIQDAQGVRLGRLSELEIDHLMIDGGTGLHGPDLEQLPPDLRELTVYRPDFQTPLSRLRLPASLEFLNLADACWRGVEHRWIDQGFDSIDWQSLPRLRELSLSVAGRPMRRSFAFVRDLPALERLTVHGFIDDTPGGSPVMPPFTGRPTPLGSIVGLDAETQRDLAAQEGPPPVPASTPDAGGWEIHPSSPDGWTAYGSLHEELAADSQEGDEYEVAEQARLRIADAEPALSLRLSFESESGGTQISASVGDDIAAALTFLGIEYAFVAEGD